MTEKETILLLKALKRKKQMTRKQLRDYIGSQEDIVIYAFRDYVKLISEPKWVSGERISSDDDVFTISDMGIDRLDAYKERRESVITVRLAIIISAASLLISLVALLK